MSTWFSTLVIAVCSLALAALLWTADTRPQTTPAASVPPSAVVLTR